MSVVESFNAGNEADMEGWSEMLPPAQASTPAPQEPSSLDTSPQESSDERTYSELQSTNELEDNTEEVDVENIKPEDLSISPAQVVDKRNPLKLEEADVVNGRQRFYVRVKYDKTRKNELSLIINKFKFTKSREGAKPRIFWRCSKRTCRATANTLDFEVQSAFIVHNHEAPTIDEYSQPGVFESEGTKVPIFVQNREPRPAKVNNKKSLKRHLLSVKNDQSSSENIEQQGDLPCSSVGSNHHEDFKVPVTPQTPVMPQNFAQMTPTGQAFIKSMLAFQANGYPQNMIPKVLPYRPIPIPGVYPQVTTSSPMTLPSQIPISVAAHLPQAVNDEITSAASSQAQQAVPQVPVSLTSQMPNIAAQLPNVGHVAPAPAHLPSMAAEYPNVGHVAPAPAHVPSMAAHIPPYNNHQDISPEPSPKRRHVETETDSPSVMSQIDPGTIPRLIQILNMVCERLGSITTISEMNDAIELMNKTLDALRKLDEFQRRDRA